MDLSGGARKSLRKAVNRVARTYTAELHLAGDLDAATLAQLAVVNESWRDGAAERGFSMAGDAIADELLPDAVVVLARGTDGSVGGFLQFVPVFGRPQVSLGYMCRAHDTPNGLTEFLVVHAGELLAERGIEEFSLNFAAFGRWLRAPANPLQRALATLLRVGDRWFQVERLERFDAKFDPRWQPRYLLFDGVLAMPRVAVAALCVEGQIQLPAPRHRRPALASAPANVAA
jgi:lysyl-tRNA synthetase, class II